MSNALAPIGVFDSGVGGLTVARAIIDQLPDEDIVYVGDTGNGPYGPLTILVGLPARCPRTLWRAGGRGDPARRPPGRCHHS